MPISQKVLITLQKDLVLCIVWNIFRHPHIQLRYIQPYCGRTKTLSNSCIFRALVHLETKIYSEVRQGHAVWHSHIYKPAIIRTLPYSEFRHIHNLFIKVYSGIFNNDIYNNINFLFLPFNLTFQGNLKNLNMFFDYNDINFNAPWVYLNNKGSLNIAL